MTARLYFTDDKVHLDCARVDVWEQLGVATTCEVGAVSAEPIDRAALLGQACAIVLETRHGAREIIGVVTAITSRMTSQANDARQVRLTVRSALAVLGLRQRTHVFQHASVPKIVRDVVTKGGYPSDDANFARPTGHAPRDYVTQYDETDASFVRRLCEEEGLYFRFEAREGREHFILEDDSTHAPAATHGPLMVAGREDVVSPDMLVALNCRETRTRRPGAVTLRTYDRKRPSLALEGKAKAGATVEQSVEVYEAPARFGTQVQGDTLAGRRLEALRANAATMTFVTNAVSIAPGTAVELEQGADHHGATRLHGKYFVVAVHHAWTKEAQRHHIEVAAIPHAVRFRLPRETRRPRAFGVHTAVVTGAPGDEIHVDEHGCIRVRFPWDREGPGDDKSSLPIRVMQQNMPGSMIIPRVGWEVWVMFEDGDPDRPYVIGRTYNAHQPPPRPLPANRTMTAFETLSSPGGKAKNSITYDDAAGREHMVIHAGFDKSTVVTSNAFVQTAKVENHSVGGSLTRSVGGSERVGIGQAFLAQVGSQSASVGATQKIYVKGNYSGKSASERILIGAALLEQIGNPVDGAVNLAKSAVLEGIAAQGKVGQYLSKGIGLGLGAYEGYNQPGKDGKAGGVKGAATALGMGALGMAAAHVPGGDALLATVTEAASAIPWKEKPPAEGAAEAGGGAGGAATDESKAKKAGAGHRNHIVKGPMTETIGALHAVMTPGTIGWQTSGVSTILVGASHITKTTATAVKTLGASKETLGALHVKSDGDVSRDITGALKTTVAGALKTKSDGRHNIEAGGKLTIKVGGALKMSGSHVTFVCGESTFVSASPGGVLIQADNVTITGDSKQSSKTTHK